MKAKVGRKDFDKAGFTIIELLTVMAVIAILIGLLVPALGLVRDFAKEVQQQSQFHSIEVGLELFHKDMGSYPESNENLYDTAPFPPTIGADTYAYSGANKLAEAMVGLDLLGFHPKSAFRADNQNIHEDLNGAWVAYEVYHPEQGYDATGINPLYSETAEENREAREGPYVQLESANAYEMADVYDVADLGNYQTTSNPAANEFASLVLCDVYTEQRPGGKKTGMPVLYYRARRAFDSQNYNDARGRGDDVFLYDDNFEILALGKPGDTAGTDPHALADGALGGTGNSVAGSITPEDTEDFERMIINEKVSSNLQNFQVPYNADTYVLISAGKDGEYGTADDITNFKRELQN